MTSLQALYFKMLRIRRIEQEIARRYPEQEMRTPIHLSIGQEACAVGVSSFLDNNDLMVSSHRGHAHFISKGGSLRGLICELYGKEDGCSRGIGGSMHLAEKEIGFVASTSIVAGTIPIGAGLAFAKRLKKESGIVVICLGDAAIEEGVFHETANFVGLHRLPVLFVLENNLYSCYTHLNDRQPPRSFVHVAMAHGLEFAKCNGNDVLEVGHCARMSVQGARENIPQLLVLDTYRHLEHCGPNNDDHLKYRHESEIKTWMDQDPIVSAEKDLFAKGEWTPEFVDSLASIDEEIRIEFDYAKKAKPLSSMEHPEYAPNQSL